MSVRLLRQSHRLKQGRAGQARQDAKAEAVVKEEAGVAEVEGEAEVLAVAGSDAAHARPAPVEYFLYNLYSFSFKREISL